MFTCMQMFLFKNLTCTNMAIAEVTSPLEHICAVKRFVFLFVKIKKELMTF